jgi:hypothetical protein
LAVVGTHGGANHSAQLADGKPTALDSKPLAHRCGKACWIGVVALYGIPPFPLTPPAVTSVRPAVSPLLQCLLVVLLRPRCARVARCGSRRLAAERERCRGDLHLCPLPPPPTPPVVTGRRVCVTDRASPVVCAGLLPARPSGGAHVALVLLDAATFFCGRRVEYSRRRLCANWCACPHPVTLGRAVARGVLAMALPSTPASVSYRADSSAPLLDIWWLQGLPVPLGALCVLGLSRRPPVTLPVHWCRARHHSKAAALSCPLVT